MTKAKTKFSPIENCEKQDAAYNPACDTGHSYSYANNIPQEFKIEANFIFTNIKLDKIITTYEGVILQDRFLAKDMYLLQKLFHDINVARIEITSETLEILDELFNRIISYLEQDFKEYQVMDNESPKPVNNKTEWPLKLIELKKDLQSLRNIYTEIFV